MKKGYIQIYTGNGKGKTTASMGVMIRSISAGYRVYFGQFLKLGEYNEIKSLRKLGGDMITIEQYGCGGELSHTHEDMYKKAAQEGFKKAYEAVKSGMYDVVVLDEINVAAHFKYISVDDVLNLIKAKPQTCELILTGRYADERIVESADLVTEMKEIKHYYSMGVPARDGIEK